MTGRYPVAFLFLEVSPEQVDVNVHPTKAEVRFRDQDGLYQLIQRVVSQRLHAADLTARLQLQRRKEYLPNSAADLRSPLPRDKSAPAGEDRLPSAKPREMPSAARSTATSSEPPSPAPSSQESAGRTLPPPTVSTELFTPVESATRPTPDPIERERSREAGRRAETNVPRALQVLDCYLVVEVPPDEVLFIDQHALHERILFEQLQQRLRSGQLERQQLLIPETVELSARQVALVLEQREALAELALDVEDFGGGTLVLNSYPALLGRRSPKAVLQAVVDYVLTKERVPIRQQLLHDLLSLMACHAAVRAGDRLTPEAIRELLAERALAQNSHHCPHGRPTSLRFSRRDLEHHFKRV
jgi:DNA mismatch repair protein MutL